MASVAVIRGKNSVGSGFLVKPGILATNAHVVVRERIEDLHVEFPSAPRSARGPLSCELVYENSMRDLALFSVVSNLQPLLVEDHYQFRRGQEVTVIGTPALDNGVLLENAISRGVMSSKLQDERRMLYQLNLSINPGNSDGEVLKPKRRVIGVETATMRSREALALCIPSEDLERAVKVAEARPVGEWQRVLAIHSTRGLLRDLDDMGVAYDILVRTYTKDLEEAVHSGLDLNSAHWVGRQSHDEKLRPSDDFVKASLYARLTSVGRFLVPVQIRLTSRRSGRTVWRSATSSILPLTTFAIIYQRAKHSSLFTRRKSKNLKMNWTRIDTVSDGWPSTTELWSLDRIAASSETVEPPLLRLDSGRCRSHGRSVWENHWT